MQGQVGFLASPLLSLFPMLNSLEVSFGWKSISPVEQGGRLPSGFSPGRPLSQGSPSHRVDSAGAGRSVSQGANGCFAMSVCCDRDSVAWWSCKTVCSAPLCLLLWERLLPSIAFLKEAGKEQLSGSSSVSRLY